MTSPQTARDLGHLILTLRGQRVLLDSDLAALYGVYSGRLPRGAGRRNFPHRMQVKMFHRLMQDAKFRARERTPSQ